jgi:hypothetical protein
VRTPSPSPLLFAAQLVGTLACVAVAMFLPPARGAILLVPVSHAAAGDMLARAVDHGATLIGRGPFAGSYVVYGERSRLMPVLLSNAILPVSSAAPGCGGVKW